MQIAGTNQNSFSDNIRSRPLHEYQNQGKNITLGFALACILRLDPFFYGTSMLRILILSFLDKSFF